MAETIKSQYFITAEAKAIIDASAGDKKRGEWLSKAVVEYHRLRKPVDVDAVGLQENILARLIQIEKQNAMILDALKGEE